MTGQLLMSSIDEDITGTIRGRAVLSDDGRYRYLLERHVGSGGGIAAFIMLNPSTADAFTDDPTIRRCKAFAVREGCGHLVVANLFALRSPDPADLATAPDPVGPHADWYLHHVAETADLVIAAWGANRLAAIRAARLGPLPGEVWCLGRTASGAPRHPLYVRSTAPLQRWAP